MQREVHLRRVELEQLEHGRWDLILLGLVTLERLRACGQRLPHLRRMGMDMGMGMDMARHGVHGMG